MAQYALPPGAVERRTVFGLLDADGWAWATIKATFWFLLIIFLLGYVPDRAYYFTVSPTIDLGYNAISPINLCPAENKTLPCPAPAGAVIPWEQSPPRARPARAAAAGAGTFTSGENIYIDRRHDRRRADGKRAHDDRLRDGNLTPWAEGPPLPEPRSDAAVLSLGGVPVRHRRQGRLPVRPRIPSSRASSTNGALTGWQPADVLTLPEPLSDCRRLDRRRACTSSAACTADGLSPRRTIGRLPRAAPADARAVDRGDRAAAARGRAPTARPISTGGAVYVLGGEGPNGATNSVFYLRFDTHGHPAINPDTEPTLWLGRVRRDSRLRRHCPSRATTTRRSSTRARSTCVGGYDANGAAVDTELLGRAQPDQRHDRRLDQLEATNLPAPRARGDGRRRGPARLHRRRHERRRHARRVDPPRRSSRRACRSSGSGCSA